MDGLDQNLGDLLDRPDFKEWLQRGRGGSGRTGPGLGGGFGGWGGFSPTGFGSFNPTPMQPIRRLQTGSSAAGGVPFTMSQVPGGGAQQAFTGEGQAAQQAIPKGGATPMGKTPWFRLPQQILQQAQQRQQQLPGYTGSGPGGAFTQQDDWNRWLNNTDAGWGGIMGRMLGGMGQSGMFSPTGSPAIINEIMRQVSGMGAGAASRARTQAQLGGLDPAAAASYGMQAGLRGQTDAANAGSQALLSQLMNQQQFGQNMLNGFFGMHSNNYLQQQAPRPQQGNSFAQTAGGALGASLPWILRSGL